MTITLRHLEILRAVACNRSLTHAAKQLGLSQPSLSQQLSKLEGDLGQRLVDRLRQRPASDRLRLLSPEQGGSHSRHGRGSGDRARLSSSAACAANSPSARLTSLARSLVTAASIDLKQRFPEIRLNVVELSPESVIRQLQSRRVQIALISSAVATEQTRHFTKVELSSDPYVLAVPKGMDGRREPLWRSVIMVDFGASYRDLVSGWYRRIIPDYREVARCRTHELALSMVEAGLGMAIVPMLSTQVNGRMVFDVDLFELPLEPRKVWAVLPSQYRYTQPHAQVLDMLKKGGQAAPRRYPPRFAPGRRSGPAGTAPAASRRLIGHPSRQGAAQRRFFRAVGATSHGQLPDIYVKSP